MKFSIDKTKPYNEDQHVPEIEDRGIGAQNVPATMPEEQIPSADAYERVVDSFLAALRKDMGSLAIAADEPIQDSEFFSNEAEAYMTKLLCPDNPRVIRAQ